MATKKSTKAKKPTPTATLRPVPTGLERAVGKLATQIDGRYCYGLPHYPASEKFKLGLVALGDMNLFEKHQVDAEKHADWVPFATLKGEAQFLCVSTTAPNRVGMWEQEAGELYVVWPSLADFASKVIVRTGKTPIEMMEKMLDKAHKLIEDDRCVEALELLEPAMGRLPPVVAPRYVLDDELGRVLNLYGLALKGVERWPEARAVFERGVDAGDERAELNILDILEDTNNPHGVIEHALQCRKRHYFDDYSRAWLRRYLAHAYLDIGEPAQAELELRALLDDYAITSPDKIIEAREGLEKYIAAARPGAETARAFLAWLAPKTYDVTPAEAKANRAWWDSLPARMRAKLLEKIDKKDADSASDEDVARCLDVDSLDLRRGDGTFDELGQLLRLSRIQKLSFCGDPESLEPLRTLAKLTSLTINNDVIKDFAWPSRADRDLWKAATACDREAIEKALAAGAVLESRNESGETALQIVAQEHDIELCTMLIAHGADPWACCHGESNALYFCGGDDEAAILAAAKDAGIPHPDADPWRILEVERYPRGATFDRPKGELGLDLDDGVPFKDKWPANVKVEMRTPKTDNKLFDMHPSDYRMQLVSEPLADLLRDEPKLELLPVTLVDHARKARPERYYLLNPLAIDCLIVDRCFPSWNHIDPDSINDVAAFVIDPAKVGAAKIFRPDRMNGRPTIIARELADKLKDFSGVRIEYAKR